MTMPNFHQTSCCVFILADFPLALTSAWQVIFTRRHHKNRGRQRYRERLIKKFQILIERVVPASTFPGDGPTLRPIVSDNALDNHPRLFNSPLAHGLRARRIFSNDRLEYDKTESVFAVPPHLRSVQRELTRSFAKRVLNQMIAVLASEIDLILFLNVTRQRIGQTVLKARVITPQCRSLCSINFGLTF